MRRNHGVPSLVKEEVIQRDGNKCFQCGATDVPLEGHHIQEWAERGDTSVENVILLCNECHSKIHQVPMRKAKGEGRKGPKRSGRALKRRRKRKAFIKQLREDGLL